MAVTLRQYVDGLRWIMTEKGLQRYWNELNQIVLSKAGSGITGGTTELDSGIDIADGNGTGIEPVAANPLSGPFATTGAQKTVAGEEVVPADPGGNYGPTPPHISGPKFPTAGFRPN